MTIEYDNLASAYISYRSYNPGVLRELADGSHLTPASRILEIGAGTGNYARALCELAKCSCTILEPSRTMRGGPILNVPPVQSV